MVDCLSQVLCKTDIRYKVFLSFGLNEEFQCGFFLKNCYSYYMRNTFVVMFILHTFRLFLPQAAN